MYNNSIKKITSGILLGTILVYCLPVSAFTKDETIYSNTRSNGEKYKSIVTTHLENTDDEKLLKDLTDLINIENTNGNEKYISEGNTITWEANSNDIYYKGESEKELPINISVKYELDGNEISSDEIGGKKGKVKIKIETENKLEHNVWINGQFVKMYTPFVVAIGTYINNENNENIEVKNGKKIDDGTKTFVIGLAFPGLQESLSIKKSMFEIPDSLEITMDAKNFAMNNIITYMAPLRINDDKIDIIKDLNNVYSKVNQLESASKKIEEGANTLAQGTLEYYRKSQEFNTAVGQFSNGVSTANSSYSQINNGISQIDSNSSKLQTGSKQIYEGTEQLNSGATYMKEKVDSSAKDINNLVDGAGDLAVGLKNIEGSLQTSINSENPESAQKLTALMTVELTKAGELQAENAKLQAIADSTNDEATKKSLITIIENNKKIAGELQTNAQGYKLLIESINTSTKTNLQILHDGISKARQGAEQVSQGTQMVKSSMSELSGGLGTMIDGTNKLSSGAKELSNGTAKLAEGTKQIRIGSDKMKSGLNTLETSANTIYNYDTQLTDGAKTIYEGAEQLASGINEFNETGIKKVCDFINIDVKNVTDRAQKLQELAEKYKTFTVENTDVESKVKFITIIDSIKNTEDNNNQEELDKKPAN